MTLKFLSMDVERMQLLKLILVLVLLSGKDKILTQMRSQLFSCSARLPRENCIALNNTSGDTRTRC
jgi:hypothetical protein